MVKSLIEASRCPVPREALQHSARHEIKEDLHGALLSSRTVNWRRIAVLRVFCAGIAEPFSGDAAAGSRFCAAINPYLREPMRPALGGQSMGRLHHD